MIRVLLLVALLLVSGCSSIELGAQYVTGYYCDKPAKDRYLLRYNVNHFVYPHKIEITCDAGQKPRARLPAELVEVPEVIER